MDKIKKIRIDYKRNFEDLKNAYDKQQVVVIAQREVIDNQRIALGILAQTIAVYNKWEKI